MATMVGESQWTKARIASLSDLQLARMNYDEMVRIVLIADVPVRNVERIQTMEGDTLMRLAHMARARCRREPVVADAPELTPRTEQSQSMVSHR
jgi:hypothetical protein